MTALRTLSRRPSEVHQHHLGICLNLPRSSISYGAVFGGDGGDDFSTFEFRS